MLQSRYSPRREAERALCDPQAGFSRDFCVFAGLGLGYYCLEYAKRFPDALLAIAEPDVNIFLLCLKHVNLAPLLSSSKAIFFIGLMPSDCAAAIDDLQEKAGRAPNVFSPPALAKPNEAWFKAFHEELRKRKEKKEINKNTLRRFGRLWQRNVIRNKNEMKERQGIALFKGAFEGLPALLLAAGPSLDEALPRLKALRERCVVVCVDTALRACLRSDVQPDFVVLADPQYWNYRHIGGLSCPGAILITEADVCPAAFRLNCRDIFLCSSHFPLAKFIEERAEKKGELGAGGSVATTAWDFARYIGASRIYVAGLDLGYPQGKTHFRGALFEEQAHAASSRLMTAEGASAAALFSAGAFYAESMAGGEVLTDKRLSLYAWWFESAFASSGVETALLSAEGVKIKGALLASIEEIEALPRRREQIDKLIDKIEADSAEERKKSRKERAKAFEKAASELTRALKDILALAKRGEALCERLIAAEKPATAAELAALQDISKAIAAHPAKPLLAAAFAESEDFPATQGAIKEETLSAAALERQLKLCKRISEAAEASACAYMST